MSEINNRIRKIRSVFCDDSNKKFAEAMGKSCSYVSDMCNNGAVGKQTIDKILTLYPQVSRAWLMLGDGHMLTEDNIRHNDPSLELKSETEKSSADVRPSAPAPTTDSISIPMVAWNVIQKQADSLAAKDEQITQLIKLIGKKTGEDYLTMSLVSEDESDAYAKKE